MIEIENNIICKYFGICGGCSYQDITYEEQLKMKQTKLFELFKDFEIEDIRNIIPSDKIFFYRNKVEFVFGKNFYEIIIGFRKKNCYWDIVDIRECLLISEKANKIVNIIRDWANKNNLSHYDQKTHNGLLRYLVIRETISGDILVNIIINATKYQFEYELKNKFYCLKNIFIDFSCNVNILVSLYTLKGDAAKSEQTFIIFGKDYIEEKLDKFLFRISKNTFFQTNKFTTIKLYTAIKNLIKKNGSNCLDVYSGSGTIGIFVNDLFEKIICIESNPEAVSDAIKNIEINNTKNCEFIQERAEIILKKLSRSKFSIELSTVILDPPRAGVAKNAIEGIINLNPQQIIYVSCNPETLKKDLEKLIKCYKIRILEPVDMFPHTPHIEIVCELFHR